MRWNYTHLKLILRGEVEAIAAWSRHRFEIKSKQRAIRVRIVVLNNTSFNPFAGISVTGPLCRPNARTHTHSHTYTRSVWPTNCQLNPISHWRMCVFSRWTCATCARVYGRIKIWSNLRVPGRPRCLTLIEHLNNSCTNVNCMPKMQHGTLKFNPPSQYAHHKNPERRRAVVVCVLQAPLTRTHARDRVSGI